MKLIMFLTTLALTIYPSTGFLPNKARAVALGLVGFSLDSTVTHKDMTRAAILNVAAEVLIDNPNPESEESSSRISALSSLSEESLVTAYYGTRQPSKTEAFEDVIDVINDANEDVDLGTEELDAAAHFDSEQIQVGQNRLVEIRQNIVTQILSSNFALARTETGRLSHTLQDFYSHSNWIENGNHLPYRVLGKPNERPSNIADHATQTCTDCDGSRTIYWWDYLNEAAMLVDPYTCNDNVITRLLTTGYYVDQLDINDKEIEKPAGKCSHGGFLDTTSSMNANGGINKDSPVQLWSPHFYLFEEAARVAQLATEEILRGIRSDVSNDELFSEYLGLDVVQDVSIAYVIDTTGSMGKVLPEIQAALPAIRVNLRDYVSSFGGKTRVRYILVPFSDPDPGTLFETEDTEEFLASIARLTANGGGRDEPEPIIGAVIRAMDASEPGSPIYVFTEDASASDEHRLNEANSQALRKNVRITFAVLNSLAGKRSRDYKHTRARAQAGSRNVYEHLAAISDGQFLRVSTSEVSKLASIVSFSAVQNRRTIFHRSEVIYGTVEHSIPVDSSLVNVLLSINGDSVRVSVKTPQGHDQSDLAQYSTSLVSSTSHIAHINITDNSLRGEWKVIIQSQGTYSFQALGSSGLRFSEVLFNIDTSSRHGFKKIDGRPTQGQPLSALIMVEGGDLALTDSALNLLSNSGTILLSIKDLTSLGGVSYMGTFIPPSEAFVLQLVGTDDNGYSFSYISDTSVKASAIHLALSKSNSGHLIMRPGEKKTVTLVMLNHGQDAQFTLAVNTAVTGSDNTDFFAYTVTPTTAFLEQDSSTERDIEITLPGDITDGAAITFTVVAESTLHNDSNFATFYVVTTTRPQPEFTDNLSGDILAEPQN